MPGTSLDGLIPFVVVAQTRSFTAAAARLRVTRSAISQTIKALEGRLGVALFARTTRDVGLTEAGAAFYAEVRAPVAALLAAQEMATAAASGPSGLLRVTAPRLAAMQLIAPRLPGFLAAFPDIRVEISCDDGFANIVEQGFDAGIRLGESIEDDMVAVRLSPADRLLVIGSPDYFARHGHPEHPRALAGHRCINYREPFKGGLYRWDFEEDGEAFSVAVEGPLVVNDTEMKLSATVAGIGLSCELESIATPQLRAGRVVATLTDFAAATPGFFLYFPRSSHIAPKLRAFIDSFRLRASARPVSG